MPTLITASDVLTDSFPDAHVLIGDELLDGQVSLLSQPADTAFGAEDLQLWAAVVSLWPKDGFLRANNVTLMTM